jgi:hypothetical protein
MPRACSLHVREGGDAAAFRLESRGLFKNVGLVIGQAKLNVFSVPFILAGVGAAALFSPTFQKPVG